MVNVRLTAVAGPNTAAVWKDVEFSGISEILACGKVQCEQVPARVGLQPHQAEAWSGRDRTQTSSCAWPLNVAANAGVKINP